MCVTHVIAHNGNEQVRNAGRAHFAEAGELLAIRTLEEQDAPAQPLALLYGLEGPCCRDFLGMHHDFQIA